MQAIFLHLAPGLHLMFYIVITCLEISVEIFFLKVLLFFIIFLSSVSLCYEFFASCLGYVLWSSLYCNDM
jgi:hypothetical protein